MTSNATRQARRAFAREFVTLRDYHMVQDRIESAMHAPEGGAYGERATREQGAEAWDNGVKTGT